MATPTRDEPALEHLGEFGDSIVTPFDPNMPDPTGPLTREQVVIASGPYPYLNNDQLRERNVEAETHSKRENKKSNICFVLAFCFVPFAGILQVDFLPGWLKALIFGLSLIGVLVLFLVGIGFGMLCIQCQNTIRSIKKEAQRRELKL